MLKKILFLTTAHRYDDDRIFYHQAKSLKDQGFEVEICSLCSDFNGNIDGIEIKAFPVLHESTKHKTDIFLKICAEFQPDCIICSEPLAVISAKKFAKQKKVTIVYDITEWYPSFRMLQPYSFFVRYFQAVKFFLIQLYAGFCSTHFIFGEESKKFPLAYVFPFKKKLMLPYYPDEMYIEKNIRKLDPEKITLCCTGRISKEDGIENFFKAADVFRKKNPDVQVSIVIVGAPKRKEDEAYFSDLLNLYNWKNIVIKKPAPFQLFTQSYSEADICFDLRENNPEYSKSLPIKIFYYIGSGKPVMYTHLKAIEKHLDISKFGYSVNPEDSETIAKYISGYIKNPELYDLHAGNARKEYEEKYNWNKIRDSFISFIRQSVQ